MKVERVIKYGSVVLAVSGSIALYIGVRMSKKVKKAIANMNAAIDELAESTPVEISEKIVERAAEKAADNAAEKAIDVVRKDINLKVYNTVTSAYKNVEEETRDKLAKEIERGFDMEELKTSVKSKASSAIIEKFLNNLSDYSDPIMTCLANVTARKESHT